MSILRVGIIAEGQSDWRVLEAVMRAIHSEIEFEHLRPDVTLASRSSFGWKGVRSWCRENGPRLEVLMTGIAGRPLHLLVIHADCSMAHNEGAERPCPPASDTAKALREVILSSWLNRRPRPSFLIIANPSKTTDAWVASTLDPPHPNLDDIECLLGAEDELARRGHLRRKDGKVQKQERRYAPLADQVASQLDRVCTCCTQASVFRDEFTLASLWQLWTS